ncbi:tetratricopeptide repeat protein [Herbaspirillum camelliae]|uniref:tetratricopeptide repeat protein n=1 Tax=Herbaspirillum camelliae TaxID=1892903 RepID=UPI000949CD57|nr:SEL1-like repeat protein [Herbaspirillum camelliae]
MATRDALPIIRAARTGTAAAQLALGARYFYGMSGLPQSTGTAFYWLERAARQNLEEAFMMIGQNVPYETVATMARPYEAAPWYEKAYDAGVLKAGLVFARIVLEHVKQCGVGAKKKALHVLKSLADAKDHEAQWMLAQYLHQNVPPSANRHSGAIESIEAVRFGNELTQKAAQAGIEAAQYSLSEQAWQNGSYKEYEILATPLAEKLLQRYEIARSQHVKEPLAAAQIELSSQETALLMNYAEVLQSQTKVPLLRVQRLLEIVAISGSAHARLKLGLRHARIDLAGERTFPNHGAAHYTKAIPWLLYAAHDGLPEAWHALSRIYAKSEFSQRNLITSRGYLERAAEMGLLSAQIEYAQTSWRYRRESQFNDIRAAYWWLKAAEQGDVQARKELEAFAKLPLKGKWAEQILDQVTTKIRKANPFLSIRLEIAVAFGLSRPEALLLDFRKGDHGHCLEVDISKYHAKSRRRLVLVDSEEQREVLKAAARVFGDVDLSTNGPEGNYRKRQYKLKTLLPSSTP